MGPSSSLPAGRLPQRLDLLVRQRAPLAGAEAAEGEGAEAGATQAPDGVADSVEHDAHLALAALVDAELDRGSASVRRRVDDAGGSRSGAAAFNLEPLPETVQRLLAGDTPHLGEVGLLHLAGGVSQQVGEVAVVGEE